MARTRTWYRATLLLPLAIALAAGTAQATLLLEENFSYSTGQLLTVSGGNWINFSGAGSNPVLVSGGSLTYAGYASSGIGNKIGIIDTTATAEDDGRAFSQGQAIGSTVYLAFLLNVTDTAGLAANSSTTGDYFASLVPSSSVSYIGRVSIRKGAGSNTYNLGLRASSTNTAAAWAAADLVPGTTYMVMVRYRMIGGNANDSVALFVDPSLAGPEPTPDISQVSASAGEPDSIGRVAIRQGNAGTPNASIDGIRAGTLWDDIKGVLPVNPEVMAVSPANNAAGVLPNAAISVTFDRLMDAATVNGTSFTVAGHKQPVYTADSIRPATDSQSFTFYADSLRKGDTVTVTLDTTVADTGGNRLLAAYTWTFYTVIPETIRPYLVSSTPANGASRLPVDISVVLTFSEALQPATADTAAIELLGRRQAKYPISAPVLSAGNTVVTVSPIDSLYYGDTITVHIKPTLTDVSGNALRDTNVTFSTRPNPSLAIYDIQYTTAADGHSMYEGQVVTFTGVVTAPSSSFNGSYFVQDGPGQWNGMYCYDNRHNAVLGDSVRITGTVSEYGTPANFSMTEMTNVTEYTLLKSGCALPPPTVVSTATLASSSAVGESYESVLIQCNNVRVTNASLGYGEWAIDDGSGPCRVDDMAGYTGYGYTPVTGDSLIFVRGVLNSNYGDLKIEPRMIGDVLDRKPVKIRATLPMNDSAMVATITPVLVGFNKALLFSSLNTSRITMTGAVSGSHPYQGYYSSSGWYCRLEPETPFAEAETVSVWVSHEVTDSLGNTLDGNGDGISSNTAADDYRFKFIVVDSLLAIADVQRTDSTGYNSAMNGKDVRIQGVLTGPSDCFSNSTWTTTASFYIQDYTSGANIFCSGILRTSSLINNLGRVIVVKGKVTEYNGVTEITTNDTLIWFWDYAKELPHTDTMVYNQFLTEDMEGELVEVEGSISSPPSYAGGAYNMEIRNGDATIAVRFGEGVGIPLDKMTSGQKLHVIGVVSQYDKYAPYDAGYQINPRYSKPYTYHGVSYPADMTLLADTVAPLGSAEIVSVAPNPFCPDWGETMVTELNGPLSDRLTLRVYDLKGRLVKTLLNSVPGGHQVCRWDGTDNGRRRASIGMYVLHLRSVATDGQVRDKSMVVVLGTPLK